METCKTCVWYESEQAYCLRIGAHAPEGGRCDEWAEDVTGEGECEDG